MILMKKSKVVLAGMFILTILTLCSCKGMSGTYSDEIQRDVFEQKSDDNEVVSLNVFAAASMAETLTELGDRYMLSHENIHVYFTFDSSGTLKTQIEEGAEADIFISAAQLQMDQLDASVSSDINTDNLDYVLSESRVNLLENKVALVVPEGNPADIHSYNDMVNGLEAGAILLAMGNSDVPAGQYAHRILDFWDVDEDEIVKKGSITYGSNVKEVAAQVTEGTVDCGIIYKTDAYSAGLTVVDTATEGMCGMVIYPAAVMKGSQNQETASDFLDYLMSEEAGEVFKKVGFEPIAVK